MVLKGKIIAKSSFINCRTFWSPTVGCRKYLLVSYICKTKKTDEIRKYLQKIENQEKNSIFLLSMLENDQSFDKNRTDRQCSCTDGLDCKIFWLSKKLK